MRRFADRRDAGRALAAELVDEFTDVPAAEPAASPRLVVLALPRGGVPVAFEVAQALVAPLDVLVSRKIGAPGRPEFGIGAVAEHDVTIFDEATIRALRVTPHDLDAQMRVERDELERRVDRYRGGRDLPDLVGADVVLVDDGLATGVTAEAAIASVRLLAPRRVVLAVPVAAPDTVMRLAALADAVVAVGQPHDLRSVGQWYDDFTQTSDTEVLELLDRSRRVSGPLRSQADGDD